MDAPLRGYSLDFIQSMISEQSGQDSGWFNDLELKSAFQPAFSLPHGRAIGFEANLRAVGPAMQPISPQTLFGPVENYAETSMLDMLCATLHVRSFCTPQLPRGLLLINLHPEVLLDFAHSAPYLAALLRHYRLAAAKVVIDVPGSILEDPKLDEAIAAYREVGCLIAIDDFGMDNANLDTIWHASPALVKIDRTLTARAVRDRSLRRTLPKALSLLHEMGTLAMMEGVGSESEALISIDSDADFASGFYFGPVCDSVHEFHDSSDMLAGLWRIFRENPQPVDSSAASDRLTLEDGALRSSTIRKFRNASPEEIGRYREERRPFLSALEDVAARLRSGKPLRACADEFLALPGSIRCYALDGDGIQAQEEVMSPTAPPAESTDFQGLSGHPGGNWSRRDFFRRAVREPGVVQVTRQYCSLSGYPRCVTFSIVVSIAFKPVVVCGDVDWTSHSSVRARSGV